MRLSIILHLVQHIAMIIATTHDHNNIIKENYNILNLPKTSNEESYCNCGNNNYDVKVKEAAIYAVKKLQELSDSGMYETLTLGHIVSFNITKGIFY